MTANYHPALHRISASTGSRICRAEIFGAPRCYDIGDVRRYGRPGSISASNARRRLPIQCGAWMPFDDAILFSESNLRRAKHQCRHNCLIYVRQAEHSCSTERVKSWWAIDTGAPILVNLQSFARLQNQNKLREGANSLQSDIPKM